MPSIVGKRRGNQTYYYLVESARVDGKPRIVSQQYLGNAEEVLAKLSGDPVGQPVRSQHRRFGDVAVVWSILDGLDVVGLVDDVVPRHGHAGASAGTYLALATLNRVVDPCSKRAFADWWATTSGPRWVKVDDAALDHRRFWDAMDLLGEDDLRAIETSVYGGMIDRYGLDLAGMALDMTNFATYIDSTNQRAPIAQRGKAKQKRTDLRLVGLALVVTRDGGIPIVSHAYPGDRPDAGRLQSL
jgi:transposase